MCLHAKAMDNQVKHVVKHIQLLNLIQIVVTGQQ